jgi:hypothetical protein
MSPQTLLALYGAWRAGVADGRFHSPACAPALALVPCAVPLPVLLAPGINTDDSVIYNNITAPKLLNKRTPAYSAAWARPRIQTTSARCDLLCEH